MNGIDPEAYLHNVIERVAEHPVNRIGELLLWDVASLLPATACIHPVLQFDLACPSITFSTALTGCLPRNRRTASRNGCSLLRNACSANRNEGRESGWRYCGWLNPPAVMVAPFGRHRRCGLTGHDISCMVASHLQGDCAWRGGWLRTYTWPHPVCQMIWSTASRCWIAYIHSAC
jgi:hypothetical protein